MKLKNIIITFVAVSILCISLAYSSSITGNLYKAFSKSLDPNEIAEENITVRKYYNMTIRFRYSMEGSDLSFSDDDGEIILKDSTSEIQRVGGINKGKVYVKKDKLEIDSLKYVDVVNIDKFDDISNQQVNITFYGTKAYLTIIVSKRQGNASLQGYIIDDLTSQSLDGLTIMAFEKNSDPAIAEPVAQAVSENGRYSLTLQADSDGKSYDIYVKDYSVTT